MQTPLAFHFTSFASLIECIRHTLQEIRNVITDKHAGKYINAHKIHIN